MSSLWRSRVFSMRGLAGLAAAGSLLYRGGEDAPFGWVLRSAHADPSKSASGALDPNAFRSFELIEKQQLTRDTFLYRFALPDNQVSGIFTASCLVTKANVPGEDKPVIRPYTPVSAPEAQGHLDLVVKVYKAGKMSQHIDHLQIGEKLEMKGPIPKYPYKPNDKKAIGMVAGGTGITPMLQVIETALKDPSDKTNFSLVYGNVSDQDIILKDRLDALQAKHPKRFYVHYVVDRTTLPGWKGDVGYINKKMLETFLPAPGADTMVMVCGPPGLMNAISGNKAPDYSQGEVSGLLKDLGYTKEGVYKF